MVFKFLKLIGIGTGTRAEGSPARLFRLRYRVKGGSVMVTVTVTIRESVAAQPWSPALLLTHIAHASHEDELEERLVDVALLRAETGPYNAQLEQIERNRDKNKGKRNNFHHRLRFHHNRRCCCNER